MLIRNILSQLALPPGINLVLVLLGLIIALRFRRLGLLLAGVAVASVFALALAPVKQQLYLPLEQYPALTFTALDALDNEKTAVVVLGGGLNSHAPEYGAPTVTDASLRRVFFLRELLAHSDLPVALTGGKPWGESVSEADRMALALTRLGRTPRWLEEDSHTTWENAVNTAALLQREGIETVVLVSDAWHLWRGVECFLAQGFSVVPAPTRFRSDRYDDPRDWIPDAKSLFYSSEALHEWLGILMYRISYGTEAAPAPGADGVIPARPR